jgi:cysteine desulfurase
MDSNRSVNQNVGVRYFDNNATHGLSASARAAWLDAVDRFQANPSSPHRPGARASAAMDAARDKLAGTLGCKAFDLIWTSGATEANNSIIHHLSLLDDPSAEIWVSGIEHPCVAASLDKWLPGRQRRVPVNRDGVVELGWIEANLSKHRPLALFVMAANNETGVLQPWRKVQELCHNAGVLHVCDAAQWVGKLPSKGLGDSDFVSGCAHKFGGPPGVGFLKCPPGFKPLLVGGPQEEGRRAGTENVPGILSMVAALIEREESLESGAIPERLTRREQFEREINRRIDGVEVLAKNADRLWNTSSVLMPALSDCRRRWVVKLDKLGFAVSTGSACSSGKEKPSAVLTAMGYPADVSDRMLRFSAGWDTTEDDWTALAEVLTLADSELRPRH